MTEAGKTRAAPDPKLVLGRGVSGGRSLGDRRDRPDQDHPPGQGKKGSRLGVFRQRGEGKDPGKEQPPADAVSRQERVLDAIPEKEDLIKKSESPAPVSHK